LISFPVLASGSWVSNKSDDESISGSWEPSVESSNSGSSSSWVNLCLPGQYSPAPATGCLTCPAGFVTDSLNWSGASLCTACDAGQYSNVSTVACVACEAGRYQGSTGNTSCLMCGAGL
jgi:hypothetical protein